MARYKPYSYAQGKFIPVHFESQILPGTFEFALNHVIDNTLDLSIFDNRYKNDETGSPAYDPRILLKIILFAYSRGIVSSRKIARVCSENVVFMALSADTRPHFTTIADFIATMDKEIISLFRAAYELFYKFDAKKYSRFERRTYELKNAIKLGDKVDKSTIHLHNLARILNSLYGDIFTLKFKD